MPNPIKVACAVILQGSKILVTRRGKQMSQPLKWEFPGGKLEPGEAAREALIREIAEELHIDIVVGKSLAPVIYHYPNISIELIPFLARKKNGEIFLSEHDEYRWATPDELREFDWAPADVPLMMEVVEFLAL